MHKNKTLIGFFILLVLANSSLAGDAASHDDHDHGEVASSHGSISAHAGAASLELLHQAAQAENAGDHPVQAHDGEDCFCDDICCASSIGFSMTGSAENLPVSDNRSALRVNLYQSVSLDLLLQPPSA